MAVGKNSTRMILTIPKELKEKLEQIADKDGRSASNYVVRLIEKDIEAQMTSP